MSDFFDPTKDADTDLLHSDVRDHTELSKVVDKVEWELINAFSQRDMQGLSTVQAFFHYESGVDPNDEIKVRLTGYDEDTPADSEDGLKEALRRTIAEIVSWVLRNYDYPQGGVQSKTQGKRSISYVRSIPDWRQWPGGWDRHLKNYDARLQPYGI